ncbi:MAG: hypothetical protein IKB38_00890 [Clostridia bacterium]|nr:hypothetical protein [Clostridia bacterium]
MKKSKKGAKKHSSVTSKKKILIISAAVLVIVAAIALAFIFAGDGQTGDGQDNPSESVAATFAEHLKKLKLEGKIASNYTLSETNLKDEEDRLSGEGVSVKLISGCGAAKGEDKIIAYECSSAAEAQILYQYYLENLISTHTAVIRGTTVISGPAGFLEDVLRGFS